MNCEQCDERLIDHVFAELEPEPHAAVTQHLADCPRCALAFCRLRADLDGVARTEAPPPGLRTRVRAAAAESFAPPRWRRALAVVWRPVPAYGLAVASLVPVMCWALLRLWPAEEAGLESVRVVDYDASAPIVRPADLM